MNKTNKVYTHVVEALGCSVEKDHCIHWRGNPILVDGKKTYLPVSSVLSEVGFDRVFFHPACESIVSKETEIDKVIRKLISSSLYFNFRSVADVLTTVLQKKQHKNMPADILEHLPTMGDIDESVVRDIVDLVKRISMKIEYEGEDSRILSMTLSRGGKTENDEHIYYRCTPSFPFYNELVRVVNQHSSLADTPKEKVIFCEQKYSYQAAFWICRFFEVALPSVKDPSRAETVVTTQTAARFCAMMRTFGHLAGEINAVVGKFRKEFDKIGFYGIDLSWVEDLDTIHEYALLIPPLRYNSNNTVNVKEQPTIGIRDIDSTYVAVPAEVTNTYSDKPYVAPHHRVDTHPQSPYAQQSQPAQPVHGQPPQPEAYPGEAYEGMTVYNNGVHEFRFRNGDKVRIVELLANGTKVGERVIDDRPHTDYRRGYDPLYERDYRRDMPPPHWDQWAEKERRDAGPRTSHNYYMRPDYIK